VQGSGVTLPPGVAALNLNVNPDGSARVTVRFR